MGRIFIGLGVVVAVVVVIFVIAAASYKPETGAEVAARIRAACEKEYGNDGETAVNECFIREAGSLLDQRERDRQDRVDQASRP